MKTTINNTHEIYVLVRVFAEFVVFNSSVVPESLFTVSIGKKITLIADINCSVMKLRESQYVQFYIACVFIMN